ncbi:hypothetical protein Q8G81_32800, partial [Klebsiella pneumoniae]
MQYSRSRRRKISAPQFLVARDSIPVRASGRPAGVRNRSPSGQVSLLTARGRKQESPLLPEDALSQAKAGSNS